MAWCWFVLHPTPPAWCAGMACARVSYSSLRNEHCMKCSLECWLTTLMHACEPRAGTMHGHAISSASYRVHFDPAFAPHPRHHTQSQVLPPASQKLNPWGQATCHLCSLLGTDHQWHNLPLGVCPSCHGARACYDVIDCIFDVQHLMFRGV